MPGEEESKRHIPDFDHKRPYRPSLKDQVEGLKAQLDAGEITEEEFEEARKKLLGEWQGRDFDKRED